MQESSIVARIAAPIFMNMVGKSPDYGARIYLTGALAEPKDHVSFPHSPTKRVLALMAVFPGTRSPLRNPLADGF